MVLNSLKHSIVWFQIPSGSGETYGSVLLSHVVAGVAEKFMAMQLGLWISRLYEIPTVESRTRVNP